MITDPASPPKILIVDDKPANIQLLVDMLKNRGYKIRTALNGRLAILAAQNDPPDLILMDISMPEMDGFEVCERLKKDGSLQEIPIIFISAHTEQKEKVRAFSSGGVDYLTKPFHLEEVQARVDTHLTLKAAREYLKERNHFLESAFSRYVSPKVVEQLKSRPVDEFLHMERRLVTVLFADLRNSSSLAYEVSAEDLQETINSFLAVMVDCIESREGLVDKFLGDGVMALFGAPIQQVDHAGRAITAAVVMQKAHREWMAARVAQNRPYRPLGIGLASGEVVVGSYGTPRRMEYTALGQAVHMAAHLTEIAGDSEILTIPATRDEALKHAAEPQPWKFSAKGDFTFKLRKEPVPVLLVSG